MCMETSSNPMSSMNWLAFGSSAGPYLTMKLLSSNFRSLFFLTCLEQHLLCDGATRRNKPQSIKTPTGTASRFRCFLPKLNTWLHLGVLKISAPTIFFLVGGFSPFHPYTHIHTHALFDKKTPHFFKGKSSPFPTPNTSIQVVQNLHLLFAET